ncbi:MAG: rod shape-determining protein MreC [Bacteroidia bacterium]|nr:rod shape-determining protein MreC [Bacteroidia bacterium]
MERLLLFFYQYRAFFTFIALELFCAWLIIENNQYQGAKFFNSSNAFVASINGFSYNMRSYFSLTETNELLALENAELRKKLEQRNQSLFLLDSTRSSDQEIVNRFDFVSARVVNNSVDRFTNFITINRGRDAGIESGMAVISSEGAIGKVKVVSEHYAVVSSLLNRDVLVSAAIKRTGHFGTIQWDGIDPTAIRFNYIPRHVDPHVGDTIATSGYNAIFPEGILIGTIASVELSDEALFYDLVVKLSQDFQKLSYVEVVRSNLKVEQDSLEQTMEDFMR